MVTWQSIPLHDAARNWDAWLSSFKDRHIKQTWAWNNLKKGSWQIVPTALFNGSAPMALGLCRLRRAPLGAATAVWLNGGPVFTKDRPRDMNLSYLGKYLDGLKEHFSRERRLVLRLNPGIRADVETQLVLRQAGFERPANPLDTGLTYVVDLTQSLEELHGRLERNWRNQLRCAEKAAPAIAFGRERALLERYLPLHNELVRRKKLDGQKLSLSDLEAMTRELGSGIVFMLVSSEGKDGCGGALWRFEDKAYFALSSADDFGLKRHLPNFMYWKAIEHLKEGGAKEFDLTGIDPKANWGVFNFKRGLKAQPVELMGEWEWSPSDWARRAFNLALWGAKGRLA